MEKYEKIFPWLYYHSMVVDYKCKTCEFFPATDLKGEHAQDKSSKTAVKSLQVQSCKLYNNKYMIASTQITNTEIFAFITVLVFKLLSRKIFLQTEKTIETVKK